MDKKKLRRAPLLIAVAVALPFMLGACSSSSSTSDTPSSAQGGSSPSAQAGAAQFAQCMRQNGVTNFPDPQNGRFLIGSDVQTNPHFQSAIQACQHHQPTSMPEAVRRRDRRGRSPAKALSPQAACTSGY